MPSQTRVHNEVDLDLNGKHCGFLRLPYSVHRSAYGWLPMPIVSIKNGDGPCVLLMSGNHGDEYEGQVALMKLIRSLAPEDIQGQIIFLPMANYPAAHVGTRTSPIDGGNLNRSFPGDPNGTVTLFIAHHIEEEVMPRCELMMDLHSGGSSLLYIPSVQAELEPDGTLAPQRRELAEAFGAPYTQVYLPGAENRMSEAAARRKGLMYFTTELAGAGTVTPAALATAEAGVQRALHAFGSLLEAPPDAASETRFVEVKGDEHYCFAYEDGLFEPLVELGDRVAPDQPAAAIHFPETPWREPVIESFKGNGIVICKRVPGRVQRGDCLFHLGSDWTN